MEAQLAELLVLKAIAAQTSMSKMLDALNDGANDID